jgi:hypothetical protein
MKYRNVFELRTEFQRPVTGGSLVVTVNPLAKYRPRAVLLLFYIRKTVALMQITFIRTSIAIIMSESQASAGSDSKAHTSTMFI